MDGVAELNQLMAKEAWTQEDWQRVAAVLGQMREPARKFREAVAAVLAANPDPSGAVAVKIGICRMLLCQCGEALDFLQKGTDNKERRFCQAICQKQLHQWDRALENLQYAEDRGWDSRQVNLERAEVQALAGDTESAAKTVEKLAKTSQDDADWNYVAGLRAEMSGDYDKAVARYENARRIQPNHPAATFRLAFYYDLHGNEQAAVELYRQCVTRSVSAEGALSDQPIHANALLNLAVLYEDVGHNDQAESCLRRILSANPNHARAALYLKDVQASRTMMFDEDETKRQARHNDLLAVPVTDFELSVRARNCLKKMNIRTLGDLLHVTEPELLSYKNFGETSLSEIKIMLTSKSLRLGQMREDGAAKPPARPDAEPAPAVGNEGLLATPVSQIEFSVRARKALERLGINSLGDLAAKSEPELLACRNFGQTSLNEIRRRLAEYGLRLRED